jgi:hypothetical protein
MFARRQVASDSTLWFCVLCFAACVSATGLDAELVFANDKPEFQIVAAEGGVSISEGSAHVLRYQREMKSLNGKYARANYVHPLYDFDGNELTEDFPADHKHQRGVFWAWHQVLIGEKPICDQWATQDAIWDVREVQTMVSEQGAELRTKVDWKSPNWLDEEGNQKPFVREETTIRVHRAQADARAIDFEIRLLALEPELRIGGSHDEKGYGGFSPRVRLPADVRFLGEQGEIEPKGTAVEAGAWVDVTASYGTTETKSGIAMLCHPSLPVFPPPWILRREKSMQNAVYPGATPVLLPTKEPLVLRYRLVVHRGAPTAEQIAAWQREYAALR